MIKCEIEDFLGVETRKASQCPASVEIKGNLPQLINELAILASAVIEAEITRIRKDPRIPKDVKSKSDQDLIHAFLSMIFDATLDFLYMSKEATRVDATRLYDALHGGRDDDCNKAN